LSREKLARNHSIPWSARSESAFPARLHETAFHPQDRSPNRLPWVSPTTGTGIGAVRSTTGQKPCLLGCQPSQRYPQSCPHPPFRVT
jgi:hypothetical protein